MYWLPWWHQAITFTNIVDKDQQMPIPGHNELNSSYIAIVSSYQGTHIVFIFYSELVVSS